MTITRKAIDKTYGFSVPRDYLTFLKLAKNIDGVDPEDAYDPIWIYFLSNHGATALHAECPAELVIFAWTGSDDGHYAFIVDDPSTAQDEYPIGLFYGDGSLKQVLASSFADFLGYQLREAASDFEVLEPKAQLAFRRVKSVLSKHVPLRIPNDTTSAVKEATARRRKTKNWVRTEDGFGVVVPPKSVDRAFLRSIKWPKRKSWDSKANYRLLDEAERRLKAGQPGTALVLAKNFFFHHAYVAKDTNRNWRARINRLRRIIETAYRKLGRTYAADLTHARMEFYLEWNFLTPEMARTEPPKLFGRN